MDGLGTCSKCGRSWPLTAEHWHARDLKTLLGSVAARRQCKACYNALKAEYNQRPENKALKAERARRPENKAQKAEYDQRPENKARQAEYRQRPENKARQAKRMREYNQHPGNKALKAERARSEYNQRPEVKARKAARTQRPKNKVARAVYYQVHKASIAERNRNKRKTEKYALKQWAIDNDMYWPESKTQSERAIVAANNSRARAAGLPATLTLKQWMTTLTTYNCLCAYCGGPYEVLEHIVPISGGGGTTQVNCAPSCYSCNGRKLDKVGDELGSFQPTVEAVIQRQKLLLDKAP